MNKVYYSQRDYRWAFKQYGTGTIKTSGCGPTSAAMVVSSFGTKVTPNIMADFSVSAGARIPYVGTDGNILFPAIAVKYGLDMIPTFSIIDAINCVKNGGLVACTTNGGKQGLFSTGGHIFVLVGVNGCTLEFYDPDCYEGKYYTSYRINKAKVKGNSVFVSVDNAKKEIAKYWCFTKKEDEYDMVIKELTDKYGEAKVKKAIEDMILIQQDAEWKIKGSDYLHEVCDFSSVHSHSEPITFGFLGTILSKFKK